MNIHPLHVVLPVKNALKTTLQTIEAIMKSNIDQKFDLTLYDDFSDKDVSSELDKIALQYGFNVVHLADITTTPSPNYRLILQMAQSKALSVGAHIIIVESDVVVKDNTLNDLYQYSISLENPGLIAAVTTNKKGVVNYPYLYASKMKEGVIATNKRLSFCCTLLSNSFLSSFDFNMLNSSKSWYDVFISHKATEIGYQNYLITSSKVFHRPHSSRPWKMLKYSSPIKYYWRKLSQGLDKI